MCDGPERYDMCVNASDADIRAAIVGAGRVADRHARSNDDPRATVTAVCDTDRERAGTVANPRNATVYTDYGNLFDAETIDVCYLLTPPFVRSDPAVVAAECGIDLFIEKPAAVRLDDTREVQAAIEANDIVIHSGYDLRYAHTIETAHDLIGDRMLGLVDARQWTGLPPEGWKWRRETARSYSIHIATHAYDIVRDFAGEVERVVAVGDSHIADDRLEYEDAGSASLHHRDGTVGHVSHAAFRHAGNTLDLLGEEFHLHVHRNDNLLTGEVDGEPIEVHGAESFHDRKRWERMTTASRNAVEPATRARSGRTTPTRSERSHSPSPRPRQCAATKRLCRPTRATDRNRKRGCRTCRRDVPPASVVAITGIGRRKPCGSPSPSSHARGRRRRLPEPTRKGHASGPTPRRRAHISSRVRTHRGTRPRRRERGEVYRRRA